MKSTKKKGIEGEDAACKFLKEKGYEIAERNWQIGKYEVDIIATNQSELVFIEVKFRSGTYFGEPEIFVSLKQKLNLIRAANLFAERNNVENEIRFDIIAIVKKNGKLVINHIEDAFKPEVNQY